jgi:hypothetical protein
MAVPGGYTTIKGAYFQNTPQGLAAVNDPNILKQLQSGQLSATPQTSQVSTFSPKVSDPSLAQSLTTLTSDKDAEIAALKAELEVYSQTGVTTDPETGNATNADGSPYIPPKTQVSQDYADENDLSLPGYEGYEVIPPTETAPSSVYVADLKEEEIKLQENYDKMKAQTDAITAAEIGLIQERYARYIKHQIEINESTLAFTGSSLLATGAAKHDMAEILHNDSLRLRMEQNNEKIKDLENEQASLINAAKAAQELGDYRVLEQKNEEIRAVIKEKREAAREANEEIAEADKKASERLRQVQRDNIIAEAYSLGITDVPSILSALREAGYKDFTSKDVKDTLKNIVPEGLDDLMKTLIDNDAPPDVIESVLASPDMNSAYIAAGTWGGDMPKAKDLGSVPSYVTGVQNGKIKISSVPSEIRNEVANQVDFDDIPTDDDEQKDIASMAFALSSIAGPDGYVHPKDYDIAKKKWVLAGNLVKEFDEIFSPYRNPDNPDYLLSP